MLFKVGDHLLFKDHAITYCKYLNRRPIYIATEVQEGILIRFSLAGDHPNITWKNHDKNEKWELAPPPKTKQELLIEKIYYLENKFTTRKGAHHQVPSV